MKPIIFSGLQPTGNLHIGNYLGAVKNWIDMQNSGKYECYFCIADYHSLVGDMDAAKRREQIMRTAAELLALGIDKDKCVFFVQSYVPEHTELAWIFNTITPVSELERMTQFKDKSERQEANINAGLFTYPVLQAADILLYHGMLVPVGQDQIQHIELTRDIARWFNNRYQKYFPETKHILTETPKIMSLLAPTKKMSKSLGADSVIELADNRDEIERKLKRAVTATEGGGQAPGAQNLLLMLKYFGNADEYDQFLRAERDGTIRYGDLKQTLAASIADYFAEFRKRREEFIVNPIKTQKIIESGAKKAKKVAEATMRDVRAIVGIR